MTVFLKVRDSLGLKFDAQATGNWQSWLYVLLTECDRYESLNSTSDVLADPYAECLRRLSPYRETFAYRQLAGLITSKVQ